MTSAKLGIALLLITALVVCAVAGAWKYFSDEAAWGEMDRSLIRLQSGIRYEAIINVQSRLADADAATREYSSKWRLFPFGYRQAAPAAEKGITEIEEALQWERRTTSGPGEDSDSSHLEELVRYPEVLANVKLGCDGPAVTVDASTVTTAFLTEGLKWIQAARGGGMVKPNQASMFSLAEKYHECGAAFEAAKKAAAEKQVEAERLAGEKRRQEEEAEKQAEERAKAAEAAREAAMAAKEAARQAAIKAAWENYWKTPYAHKVRIAIANGCIYGYSIMSDGHRANPAPGSPDGASYYGVQRSLEIRMTCSPSVTSGMDIQVDGKPRPLQWSKTDINGVDWYSAWIVRP